MPARSTQPGQTAPKRARRAVTTRRARTSPRTRDGSHRRQRGAAQAGLPPTVMGVLGRLGRALGAGDLPTVSACFAYPSIFLTGADTHEFRDPLQVQSVFREHLQARGQAPQAGPPAGLRAAVERADDLGHGIFAVDVRWAAADARGRAGGERAFYVIQESAVGTALIRLAVAKQD